MQLIVLGMHRSGTSVLARILNLMGLYFGPEGMSTGANPENPKGFWERRDVRLLNDALLHSVGSDWDRVSGLDLAAVPGDMQEAFDDVARRTLLEMDAHRPWFIKEPRLCVLLPVWLRHLEAPLVVNIHRDPLEVAASLHRRNGMPMEAGLELWEYYTRSAEAAARGLPAVTVLHSALMADPAAEASRLHDELAKIGVPGIRPAAAVELANFVDGRLYRERSSHGQLEAYRDSRQARLYRRLAKTGDLTDEAPVVDWPALREYERTLPPIKPPDAQKVRSSGYDAFMLDERLKSSVRRMARMESALHARLEERLGPLEREMRVLRASDSRDAAVDNPIGLAVDETVAEHVRAEQELGQRYAELALAARELAAAKEREAADAAVAKGMRGEMQALRAQMRELEGQLRKSRRERRTLVANLECERERAGRLQADLDSLVGSRSWRMTAPLRAVVRGVRKMWRR